MVDILLKNDRNSLKIQKVNRNITVVQSEKKLSLFSMGARGVRGEQGPQGERGEAGEAGPQGIQGEVGPQGETGPQGIQGIQGIQGVAGATGPKGDKGDKGDTGEQGIQGVQGIQGETGPAGLQGETGATGPTGATGAGVASGGTTGQYLKKASNTNYDTIWATLSTDVLAITDPLYQPLDADLTAIAGLSPTNDDILQRKAGAWVNRSIAQLKTDLSLSGANTGDQDLSGYLTIASASATYLTIASAASSYQPLDSDLTALAGLTSAADKLPYFSGSGTAALADFTSFGRSLVDDADAGASRTTLGLVAGGAGDIWVQKAGDTMTGALTISLASGNSLIIDTTGMVYNASNNRLGINTASPTESLSVVGNFSVDDAVTTTKGYRFRTSGSNLDVEAAGADLFLSVWSGAGYTGTQRNKFRLEAGAEITKIINDVQFVDGPFGGTHHLISGATNGDAIFNNDGQSDADFTVKSDNYDGLFVDASNDAVVIMSNALGKVSFFGATPIDRELFIADPSGGATVDSQARTAIASILDVLINYGLIAAS